jgi:hypothetical protein
LNPNGENPKINNLGFLKLNDFERPSDEIRRLR